MVPLPNSGLEVEGGSCSVDLCSCSEGGNSSRSVSSSQFGSSVVCSSGWRGALDGPAEREGLACLESCWLKLVWLEARACCSSCRPAAAAEKLID
eukprot:SAG31_NODE_604_length_13629_cov_11.035994_7_plen_95_part_00